ncbi:MAG: hypothetical protein V9E85_10770 [Candidatus Nanopelagicales bacterium]
MSTKPAGASPDRFRLYRGAEGIITGTVVCAAVIAAAAGLSTSTAQLCISIIGTVIVYWLAHVHASTIGHAVAQQVPLRSALRAGLIHSAPLAVVSLVPLSILLVAELFGAELQAAATIALCASIALLAVYGFLAGYRGGLGVRGAIVSGVAGMALGVVILLLKAAH